MVHGRLNLLLHLHGTEVVPMVVITNMLVINIIIMEVEEDIEEEVTMELEEDHHSILYKEDTGKLTMVGNLP